MGKLGTRTQGPRVNTVAMSGGKAGKRATHHASTPSAPKVDPPATLSTTHEALVSLLLETGFVLVMVVIAGTGRTAGRIAVLIMVGLLIQQATQHTTPFVEWAAAHPLTPTKADMKGTA